MESMQQQLIEALSKGIKEQVDKNTKDLCENSREFPKATLFLLGVAKLSVAYCLSAIPKSEKSEDQLKKAVHDIQNFNSLLTLIANMTENNAKAGGLESVRLKKKIARLSNENINKIIKDVIEANIFINKICPLSVPNECDLGVSYINRLMSNPIQTDDLGNLLQKLETTFVLSGANQCEASLSDNLFSKLLWTLCQWVVFGTDSVPYTELEEKVRRICREALYQQPDKSGALLTPPYQFLSPAKVEAPLASEQPNAPEPALESNDPSSISPPTPRSPVLGDKMAANSEL